MSNRLVGWIAIGYSFLTHRLASRSDEQKPRPVFRDAVLANEVTNRQSVVPAGQHAVGVALSIAAKVSKLTYIAARGGGVGRGVHHVGAKKTPF